MEVLLELSMQGHWIFYVLHNISLHALLLHEKVPVVSTRVATHPRH